MASESRTKKGRNVLISHMVQEKRGEETMKLYGEIPQLVLEYGTLIRDLKMINGKKAVIFLPFLLPSFLIVSSKLFDYILAATLSLRIQEILSRLSISFNVCLSSLSIIIPQKPSKGQLVSPPRDTDPSGNDSIGMRHKHPRD